jgi:hypothetical protein
VVSLLDTAGKWPVDVWLVFRDLPDWRERSPLWRCLKPGFQHVEAWKHGDGIWTRIEPCLQVLTTEAHITPPWEFLPESVHPTFLHVERLVPLNKLREPFFFGPVTCVELVKAIVGLRDTFVRTPWQLYKRLI